MTNIAVEPVRLQLDLSELQTGVTTIENLVKAIHDATTALNELTTALTNQSVGGTVFDVLSTAISALSLACDLKGGKAVIDFFQNMGKSIANFAEGIPMLFSILAGAAGPVTSISEAFYVAFGTGGSIVAGIVTVIGGAILAVTNFFSMLSEGFNWLNEILMLVGMAILAVGAIVLGAPAAATAAVAALIALIGTIIAAVLTKGEEMKARLNLISEWFNTTFCKDWTEQFGVIGHVINAFWATVQHVVNSVKAIFEGVITFIQGAFSGDLKTALEGVGEMISGVISLMSTRIIAILNSITGFVKTVVDSIAGVVQWVVEKLDFLNLSKNISGSATVTLQKPTIRAVPHLAQGAVLPANRPFLAVVGDQKHGTNVEAPLSTIQAAVADVLARQGTGDINITFIGDLAQLGRVLKPVIERENRRVGGSLAKGVY